MATAAILYDIFEETNYGQHEVVMKSNGSDVVVISDLHLGAGINASYNYDGTENFFADECFMRFIIYLLENQKEQKEILIINGDFIDFLRIRNLPELDGDFTAWKRYLGIVGIGKTEQELKESISKKEIEYGLKTDDYKSIWKLQRCAIGHRALFEQLAYWIKEGNKLVIVKGNHDLEWYWPAVRNYLRYMLAELMAKQQDGNKDDDIGDLVKKGVLFVDDTLIIDERIYVSHGHIYENFTAVNGDATLNNNTELNLPFGSFFNRYLINRLELAYPFLDNVRPTQKILPLLIRERFPLAIKVLFKYIPFTILIIPKKMYKQAFKYLFDFLLIIIIPVLITAYAIYTNRGIFSGNGNTSFIGRQIITIGKNFGFLFLSYILGRIVSMVRLSPPHSLYPFAKDILYNKPDIQIVTFGHTHNPEQFNHFNRWYFNTGTWMPVYDVSMADVRIEKTFTFLHIKHDVTGKINSNELLRWNDDGMRPELMILRERK